MSPHARRNRVAILGRAIAEGLTTDQAARLLGVSVAVCKKIAKANRMRWRACR